MNFPIKTLRHEYIADTGGAGKFRGGNGVDYTIEFRGVNPDVSVFGDGAVIPAYGLNGGMEGSLNEGYLNRGRENEKQLSSNEGWNRAKSGDTITVLSAGGGGWGNALDRDPAPVLDDVRNEMLTTAKARESYGVVIDGGQVDTEGTHRLRAEMRAGKEPG